MFAATRRSPRRGRACTSATRRSRGAPGGLGQAAVVADAAGRLPARRPRLAAARQADRADRRTRFGRSTSAGPTRCSRVSAPPRMPADEPRPLQPRRARTPDARRRGGAAAADVHQSLERSRRFAGSSTNTDVARLYVGARPLGRSWPTARAGSCSTSCTSTAWRSTRPWRRRGSAAGCSPYVFADAAAAGATKATLEVRRSNLAARAFYEGLGFTVEGVRRDYYRDPREDALILWLRRIGPVAAPR